jgi:glycosyltransferase involved in cell wall biosynthesis
MLSVLHVVPAAPFGGAQRLVLDLAAKQVERGIRAAVYFTRFDTMALEAAFSMGIPVSSPNAKAGRVLRALQLRKTVKSLSPAVLHLHLPPPWLPLALRGLKGSRVVSHLHVSPPSLSKQHPLQTGLIHLLHGRIVETSDELVAVSQWISAEWKRAYPQSSTRMTVIYNGISVQEMKRDGSMPRSHSVFGMASRIAPQKGMEEFLEFAKVVAEKDSTARFLIAGDGDVDYRNLLASRVKLLGLEAKLQFVGFVYPVDAFWSRLDVAVFTAPFEPFGLRLVEPLAHGVPTIAYSNNSGSDEVISKCRSIRSVPYGDVGALADLALDVITRPELRAAMSVQGRIDIAENFTLELMEIRVRSVYPMH